ncbi:hypothetical protein KTO58_05185 [Chitinophaga pendula]|uniref:hypothetical protein n=1 Tax=Chitinophaga TaxID=79328 RepID=UPI000BB07F2D|nr:MULTISPECIES: hypothetical protein [Chitinophaga]ASZ13795.1 hypothetical protein CK934_23985 [Chitinophaga sp. MD30]UCJ08586.1 hypothetical protein KTO58_05185 [Chitinophaga pendula]
MSALFNFLSSQTVLIPLSIALIRYDRVIRSFLPFILLLLVSFITECLSFLFIRVLHTSNALVLNMHGLVESLLIAYLFYRWSMLKEKRLLFGVLGATFIVVWLVENILLQQIMSFSPFFRVFYSFAVILLSINQINYMIAQDSSNLLKSATFLICIGFIIFFIYQIIYEAAYFVGQDNSDIANRIIYLFAFMNAFINMVYAIAVYHIPLKNEYYFNKHFK